MHWPIIGVLVQPYCVHFRVSCLQISNNNIVQTSPFASFVMCDTLLLRVAIKIGIKINATNANTYTHKLNETSGNCGELYIILSHNR